MKNNVIKEWTNVITALIYSAGSIFTIGKLGIWFWLIVVLVIVLVWGVFRLFSLGIDFWHEYENKVEQLGELKAEAKLNKEWITEKDKRIKELEQFEQDYFESNSKLSVLQDNLSSTVMNDTTLKQNSTLTSSE